METILDTILDYRQTAYDNKFSIKDRECFISGYMKVIDTSGEIIDNIPIFDISGTKKCSYLIKSLQNRLNHPENYTEENREETIAKLDKLIHTHIQLGILLKSAF